MNQYRCETCEKTDCDFYDSKQWWFFTFEMGCASHSDFKNRSSVLIEVLDKFDSALNMAGEDRDYQLHNLFVVITDLHKDVNRNESI
jgi:hypothetical protein